MNKRGQLIDGSRMGYPGGLVVGCQICPKGKFSDRAAFPCKLCSAGFYNPADETWKQDPKESQACTACEKGRFAAAVGASACQSCSAGSRANGPANATACLQCQAGTFSGNLSDTCPKCPAGYYQHKPGSHGCAKCKGVDKVKCRKIGGVVWPCGGAAAGKCALCSTGQYLDLSDHKADVFDTLEAGSQYEKRKKKDRHGGCTVCGACPAGKHVVGCKGTSPGRCKDCPAGKYAHEHMVTAFTPVGNRLIMQQVTNKSWVLIQPVHRDERKL
jgi:hypothetical protein